MDVIATLLASQFIPLRLGLAINRLHPKPAYLKKPANVLSAVLNLAVFGLIISVQFRMLADIHLAGCVGMLILVIATLAGSVMAATGSFPGTQAITAVLPDGIFQTIMLAFVVFAWGRLSPLEIVFTRSRAA